LSTSDRQNTRFPNHHLTSGSPSNQLSRSASLQILFFLLATVALVAGCRRLPGPPYERAFAVEGRAPRVLETVQEVAVPLTVTNTGERAWDPAHVHLSYHWLWFIPRELVLRSRTLPYHEGIRTDLAGVVSPAARVVVEGRVLAPDVPGVYWLQWDMVEEGVTWFVQVSPRPARQLVIVLPTPAGFFALLPLVLAIVGALLAGSSARRQLPPWLAAVACTADVSWCAASLFSKQMILVQETLLEPTAVAYWLTVVAAAVPPIVLMLVLPRRVRPWVLFGVGVFGALVALGDAVYYRFFGDVLSAPALLGARQTARAWGSIRSLLTPGLLWLVVDLPFALWLVIRISRLSRPMPAPRRRAAAAMVCLAALAAVGVVLSAPRVLASAALDQMFRDRAVAEQLGPFGFHAYDVWSYARFTLFRPAATAAEVDEARAWFADRRPLRAGSGPYSGFARGKNLIVVQVESLQDFVVDYRVGDQDVMPHLRRWIADSLRFTNVTDQTSEGRTSDAEFVSLVSLLPLDHGAVAFRYPGNHYLGLPRVLTEHGYSTVSAVPFDPGFWNRRVMHPSYGFQQSLFESDFQLTEQIGWGLNDRDFLQQMVPRLERLPRPFGAWLITLSLHHPFEDFPNRHKVLTLGALEGTPFGNYLHTMRFFDQALDDFKTALARDGLLSDTVLAVFGDHDAGFSAKPEAGPAVPGIGDDIAWELADRVPFLVRLPGPFVADLVNGPRSSPAGQTDFAPTLLALLGIDPAPLPYLGRNLLGRLDDPPIVRPYGGWLDSAHMFLSRGVSDAGRRCYALASGALTDQDSCRAADEAAQRTRDISRLVITEDLQQQLRDGGTRGAR
jgi:phosphoglycerol transferase MdoB-like AlkP superfamily enzyme